MGLDTRDYTDNAPYLECENNDPIRNYESVLFDLGKEDREIIEEKVYRMGLLAKKYHKQKELLVKYFELKEHLSLFGNYTSDQKQELNEIEKLLKM